METREKIRRKRRGSDAHFKKEAGRLGNQLEEKGKLKN